MDKRTIEILPVPLTREEKEQAAARLAEALDQADRLEVEFATVKRDFKDRAERLDAERRHLARLVRTGVEDRPIDCETRPNWQTVTVETFRRDTGELVNFRPMSREERQRELDIDPSDEIN